MKRFLYLLILLWCLRNLGELHSQNIVPNPGFEQIDEKRKKALLENSNFADFMVAWKSINSADIFHPHLDKVVYEYPSRDFRKQFGDQVPKSGQSFVGIHAEEYLIVRLQQEMRKGADYEVSFYASIGEKISSHCSSSLGIYFSDKKVFRPYLDSLFFTPSISSTELICFPGQWQKVSGIYTAKGGEKYLTLGRFSGSNPENRIKIKRDKSEEHEYRFIDEVYVSRVYKKLQPVSGYLAIGNIYFGSNQHELSDSAFFDVVKFYNSILNEQYNQIKIEGYTDSLGDDESNSSLSLKRAKSIKNCLIEFGVNPQKIFIDGKGSEKPLMDNASQVGRSKNRRVEISAM